MLLTTIELGDIYLSSLKAVVPGSTIRKLSYTEFCEALVRCALVAYSKISDSTILDKLRGLFLYMWRAINKNVPRAWADGRRSSVSTNAGDLLAGAQLFNRRFCAQWEADKKRDYLSPPVVEKEAGSTVLHRLVASQTSSRHMVGAAGGGGGGGGDPYAGAYGGGGGSGAGGGGGGGGGGSYGGGGTFAGGGY